MSDIQQIIDALVAFRDEREWQQFHDTKNLAVALSIEAAELNELFLWKDVAASEEVDKEKIKEELADVLAYALLLAEKQGLDVKQIVLDKIAKNAEKYPVEKARGSAQKYNELWLSIKKIKRLSWRMCAKVKLSTSFTTTSSAI